jgi:ubiquinone/menaquinone biosynthesis C-methylase UbiE
MRELTTIPTRSAAAVLSFFALHHLDSREVIASLSEWYRVLESGGQLVLAAWEGSGPIEYGDSSDVRASLHRQQDLTEWVRNAGFRVDNCVLRTFEDMGMQGVLLTATKPRGLA